jgi:sulfotransferase
MKKQIFFLSGLPRSGSTLLGSILGQNPDITVTPTSPLLDLLCHTNESFLKLNEKYTYDYETVSGNIYSTMVEAFFKNIETKFVIDKHRGHPRNILPLSKFVTENPKIICTSRDIAEVITSYITLIESNKQKDNFVDKDLGSKGIPITTENRAKILWENYISDPYQSMQHGIKNYRKHLYIVEYGKLTSDPEKELKNIYQHLGINAYKNHQFAKIENKCAEDKDEAWGLKNLHAIREKLEKKSAPPKDVLGAYLTKHYNQYNLVY